MMSDVNNGETPKQHFVCDKYIAQCPDQKHLDLRKPNSEKRNGMQRIQYAWVGRES